MMTRIKNNQGATSVLVVVMMVVLIVFGLAVLTTSLANLRLADKKKQWLSEYYNLESLVAIEQSKVHQIIEDIRESVVLYVKDEAYREQQNNMAGHRYVRALYNEQKDFTTQELQSIRALLYYHELLKELSVYIEDTPKASVRTSTYEVETFMEKAYLNPVILEYDIAEDFGEYPKHIAIRLDIQMPDMLTSEETFISMKAFEVVKHAQWQPAFDIDEGFDFEDPNFDDSNFDDPGIEDGNFDDPGIEDGQ